MPGLAWRTVRARPGQFVAAYVSLLCAAALIAASGVLTESGLRSSVPPHRYAAADAVLGGAQTFRPPGGDLTTSVRLPEPAPLPAGLVARLTALDEVAVAVGDSTTTLAVTSDGHHAPLPATGHSWDIAPLAPFQLRDGEPPRPGQVVLTASLAERLEAGPGDTVVLHVGGSPRRLVVAGTVSHPDPPDGARGDVVLLAAQDAAGLVRAPGTVQAIGLVAAPGVPPDRFRSAVQAVAPKATVYTGVQRGRIEFPDVGAARGLLLAVALSFGTLAVLLALVVVSLTMALSLHTRRREFGLLRTLGASPGQTLWLITLQVLVLAVPAAVPGALAGLPLAAVMQRWFVTLGVLPADLALVRGPLPVLGAVAVAVVTAVAAGALAGLRPALGRPGAVDDGPSRRPAVWRPLAGSVTVVLGGVAALAPVVLRTDAGAAGTGSAALLLVIGFALLGAGLLRPLFAVPLLLMRRLSAGGFLAARNTAADLRRASGVVTPIVLAVGFTLAMVTSQGILAGTVARQSQDGVVADAVVTGSPGLGPQVLDELGALPEVEALTPVQRTQVFVPYSVFADPDVAGFSAIGVDPAALPGTLDPGVVDGDLSRLGGSGIALEKTSAAALFVGIGDEVEVRLGDGTPATLTVVATYERGLGLAGAIVPAQTLAGHTGPPTTALLDAAPGTSRAELLRAVEEFTASHPTLRTADRAGFAEGARAEAELAAWVNLTGLAVLMGYVAIGVVNSLVMATLARSRELALLRLVGATRGQVLRMLQAETWLVAAGAVLLGAVAALGPLSLLSLALLGTPLPAVPPWLVAGLLVVVFGLAAGSVGLSGRAALRASP